MGELSGVLFDAVLCGADALSAELLESLAARTARVGELGALGAVLATALQLWRHDRVYGLAGSPALGRLVDEAVTRVFWLAEGMRGQGGVDFPGCGPSWPRGTPCATPSRCSPCPAAPLSPPPAGSPPTLPPRPTSAARRPACSAASPPRTNSQRPDRPEQAPRRRPDGTWHRSRQAGTGVG
ncbi:hypothetical protein ACFQZC_24800 [Streptacidiphilus monticola]